jgi:hypothetical protein
MFLVAAPPGTIAIVLVGNARRRLSAVIDDGAIETLKTFRDHFPDPAHAYDADCAIAQRVRERIGPFAPLARAQIFFGLGQFAQRIQQERNGGIGDFVVQDVRGVRDHDPVLARPPRIDRIVADAEIGDDFELRHLLHDRGRHGKLTSGRDGPDARRYLREEGAAVFRVCEAVDGKKLVHPFLDNGNHLSREQEIGAFCRGHADFPCNAVNLTKGEGLALDRPQAPSQYAALSTPKTRAGRCWNGRPTGNARGDRVDGVCRNSGSA